MKNTLRRLPASQSFEQTRNGSRRIAWIEAGGRHFDRTGTVDIIDQVFAGRVAHFEMLEEFVWLWSQPHGKSQLRLTDQAADCEVYLRVLQ